MWHGQESPGLGGFLLLAGPWSCGSPTHAIPAPGPEEARYFAQRFIVARATPPKDLKVITGFLEMNETEGRHLEQEPESIYQKQLGHITIESVDSHEWRELQKRVRQQEAIFSALRARPTRKAS
jgi:hypothetical protein